MIGDLPFLAKPPQFLRFCMHARACRSADKRITAIRSGLLVSRGGYWGSLRAAMNPLFHSSALQSYNSVMNSCGEGAD